MVWTCVDYALHQLCEIQLYQYKLDSSDDYDLYDGVCNLWEEACLGDLDSNCNPFEKISKIDSYWEESYQKVYSYKRELMFLKMIFWCFSTWDDTYASVRSLLTTLEAIWEDLEERIDDTILSKAEHWKQDWDLLASFLEGTIQQSKPLIVDYICHFLLDSMLLQCKPLPSDQSFEFFRDIFHNLEVLVRYRANAISSMKIQFDSLKLRVNLLRNFFQLIAAHGDINCEELRELEVYLHSFANNAACLAFLFWARPVNDEIRFEAKIKQLLSDLREKICKPCGSDGMALYLGALKAIKLRSTDDTLLHGQVVAGFVDLHLDSLVASKVDWLIVRDGLVFLLSFMSNPPEGCDQDEQLDSVRNKIDLLFDKCMNLIVSPHVIMDHMLLSAFAERLEETIGTVKELYVKIQDSLPYNFPRTNALGFYDLLLQNLERLIEKLDSDTTFIPFVKKFVIKIEAHMLSLRPLVTSIFELRKEQKEFEDLWLQVIHLAYRIEHVINSCSVHMHPIWYNMASLNDIIHQINDMKRKLEKEGVKRDIQMAKSYKMQYTKNSPGLLLSSSKPPERNWLTITSEQEAIGREEEMRKITDELIGGYESLGIISIIGMGGLGKTTLAKEIYNSKIVICHFHKRGITSVSQVLNRRNFFVDILHGIDNCEKEKFDYMTEDDLAHHLWRCLSGQRYLIVVDDIWDIEAWGAVKSSFPDEKNKSRVIFTTRELKVALDAKSSLHNLRLLSDDESLNLLHVKVFGKEVCPLILFQVEKIIARNCKGFPLSIVVIAGLLASNKTSSSWWEEIGEAISRFVGQECKDIIEYSYKHLPEHLKSCFLYMGIYEEDEVIYTKRFRQLWIGEGFVNKSMTKSTRTIAKEYLKDLVDRNLVMAVWRSGQGEIAGCRLHDIIRGFCQGKAEEDNFLCLGDGYEASNSSNSTTRDLYRISLQRPVGDIELATVENIHSLLCQHKKAAKSTMFVLEKLKLVQVLLFEGKAELFSHLVHLRYIAIKYWNGELLPESICNLWNLEILIIKDSGVILVLPKTIWKMKRLRHLEFGYGCVVHLDEDEYEGRQLLLENVEFLSKLYIYNDRSARAVLGKLPNIQKLTCVLENSNFPNDSDWNSVLFTIDFLDKLESLSLLSTIKTSQDFVFPSTLKRLVFKAKTALTQHMLSAIGELPCLEVLKLDGTTNRWDVEDGHFQKLKYLKVKILYLEQWNVSFDSFSCFQQLAFWNVSLKEIPACFAELPTLQRIEIVSSNKEMERSANQVQKEHMDNGNQLELTIFPTLSSLANRSSYNSSDFWG